MDTKFLITFNEEFHEYNLIIEDGSTFYSICLLPSEIKSLEKALKDRKKPHDKTGN